MAKNIITPKAIKIQCIDCGCCVDAFRKSKIRCQACRAANHLKVARASAKRRPSRDRSVVKRIDCGKCGNPFESTRAYRRYCDTCRANASGPAPHAYLKHGSEPLSATLSCEICFAVVKRKTKNHRFCSSRCSYLNKKKDAAYKLNNRMRAGMHKSISKNKGGKSWSDLAGYTVEELKRHLERQFLKGMSWENIGDWHIDHRVPLSSFHFETAESAEFKAAWELTNLQPMWARENIQKKARRLFLL